MSHLVRYDPLTVTVHVLKPPRSETLLYFFIEGKGQKLNLLGPEVQV
jgi:hypothetical protein